MLLYIGQVDIGTENTVSGNQSLSSLENQVKLVLIESKKDLFKPKSEKCVATTNHVSLAVDSEHYFDFPGLISVIGVIDAYSRQFMGLRRICFASDL